MTNQAIKETVINKIDRAQTLGDVLRAIEETYDVDNTPLGFIAKVTIKQKIRVIVDYLKPPLKK